jgi:hypothetical protein
LSSFLREELAGSFCVNITVFWDVKFFTLVDRYQKPDASAFKEEQVTVQLGQFVLHCSSPSRFHGLLLISTLLFICMSYIIFLHDLHWYLKNGGSRFLSNVRKIAHFHKALLPRTRINIAGVFAVTVHDKSV